MERSTAIYPDFDREEVAEAFASTLSERFAQNPELRNSDKIGVHAKTLAKWERGEDLPGFVTASGVLSFIDGWTLFASTLERRDRQLTACADRTVEAIGSAERSLALHPSARERRLAGNRMLDVIARAAKLCQRLREPASDEPPERRGPREVA